MAKNRKSYSPQFKAKVALEAIKGLTITKLPKTRRLEFSLKLPENGLDFGRHATNQKR